MVNRLLTRARALAHSEDGVSALEFALILPIMVILFIGGVEMADALVADRKVVRSASAVGDMVAQYTDITAGNVTDVFNSVRTIMSPYEGEPRIMVAAVNITNEGQKVSWSCARNDTPAPKNGGSPVPIPATLNVVGSQVIVSRVRYTFNSILGSTLFSFFGTDGFDLEYTQFLNPRLGNAVNMTSGSC